MTEAKRRDPFAKAGEESGILPCTFDGEAIPMVLRYRDVRGVTKDWATFTSDRVGQVPIPNELSIRQFRQLPIETDPPRHTEYRGIVNPFFRRPLHPDYIASIEKLISDMLDNACEAEEVDVIGDFALPLQSQALTIMLGVPASDAVEFVSWGIHAIRENGQNSPVKAAVVQSYIERRLAEAERAPGDDMFTALNTATFEGRKLTQEEKLGFVQLTLSGGRDTIVNTVAAIIGYLGEKPAALARLRAEPKLINTATEEFVRWLSPLSHIARVAATDTEIAGYPVKAESRVAICFASANYDSTVFESPDELRLDRMPNPHVGFGSGPHTCIGAPQARLILRAVLGQLIKKIAVIDIRNAEPAISKHTEFTRQSGYETLVVRFSPLDPRAA
jgi:cytochrome P450